MCCVVCTGRDLLRTAQQHTRDRQMARTLLSFTDTTCDVQYLGASPILPFSSRPSLPSNTLQCIFWPLPFLTRISTLQLPTNTNPPGKHKSSSPSPSLSLSPSPSPSSSSTTPTPLAAQPTRHTTERDNESVIYPCLHPDTQRSVPGRADV